ncbi:MAG: hypothetical protein V1767_03610 [Chloroflexota bacterium]
MVNALLSGSSSLSYAPEKRCQDRVEKLPRRNAGRVSISRCLTALIASWLPHKHKNTTTSSYRLQIHNLCYCGLYVSQEVVDGKKAVSPIPERRPPSGERKKSKHGIMQTGVSALPLPVWRCRVCGYLCARDEPPEVCPICRAKKERFERFM